MSAVDVLDARPAGEPAVPLPAVSQLDLLAGGRRTEVDATEAREPAEPGLAVVIASYRPRTAALTSVVGRFLQQGADEVVVVLDGPQPWAVDGLARLGDGLDRLRLFELPHNVGQSQAKACGVRLAGRALIVLVDDDILLHPGSLGRLRTELGSAPDRVVVGHVPIRPEARRRAGDAPRAIFSAEYDAAVDRWERAPDAILDGIYGGLLGVHRDLLLAAEAFRPSAPLPYFEDLDLGWRLRAVGGRAVFRRDVSGDHLHDKAIESFVAESSARRTAIGQLVARWGEVPGRTTGDDPPAVLRARRLLATVGHVPGILVLADQLLRLGHTVAARLRWWHGEEVAVRARRLVAESAPAPAEVRGAGARTAVARVVRHAAHHRVLRHLGRGVRISREAWDLEYADGRWDYMGGDAEAARYAQLSDRLRSVAPGGSLLDVGCGPGWWLARLRSEPGAPSRYVGIDLSEEAVAQARALLPGEDLRVVDYERRGFAGRFDVVAFNETIYYFGDPLGTVARALRDNVTEGGVVLLSLWDHEGYGDAAFRARLAERFDVVESSSAANDAGLTWHAVAVRAR